MSTLWDSGSEHQRHGLMRRGVHQGTNNRTRPDEYDTGADAVAFLSMPLALVRCQRVRTRCPSRSCEGPTRCRPDRRDRKSTRLNSSHLVISYAVFCLKKKNKYYTITHKH